MRTQFNPTQLGDRMTSSAGERPHALIRNEYEASVFDLYDTKRNDPLNLDLGKTDGYYHHHFAVRDFDRSLLELAGEQRETAINVELHRMETDQVQIVVNALQYLPSSARVLDAGSGRGGTALLLNRALHCQVDGVNFSTYQNGFARTEAERLQVGEQVRFHDRNMIDTGFPDGYFDAVVTNETTMHVSPDEAFAEFARVLRRGGRYVLISWCHNDAVPSDPQEVAAIDDHYRCHVHHRSTYLRVLLENDLIPYQVDDLTLAAIPYWELRSESTLASGIEPSFLSGHRADRLNYIRVISRRR
ncbi:SAM-dependent methyltransferase [Streptomyces sp. NPDC050485]|uniref:SAM-dependent methyltransferase n=1 Tax=Streptomyces sp. NPDC050485 TaxID=3365617 RepID=UPI00378AE35A